MWQVQFKNIIFIIPSKILKEGTNIHKRTKDELLEIVAYTDIIWTFGNGHMI